MNTFLFIYKPKLKSNFLILLLGLSTYLSTNLSASESFPGKNKIEKYHQLINDYCIDCHNFDDWKGKLEFESLGLEYVQEDAETWEKVIRRVRGGLMPPPGEKRPSEKQSLEFAYWLEDYIDHGNRSAENNIAAYPTFNTRRLNRKEYRNAIRDLLDIDIDVEELLPQDIAVDGFDNMVSALSVSPVYLDQSLYAARFIATQVIGNPRARPLTTQYLAEDSGNQQLHQRGMPLGTRGGMKITHYFPASGNYQLSIGNLARAMWVENQEFKNTLVALLDGKPFFQLDIGGGQDLKAIDTEGGSAVDAINARLKNIPFTASAGFHDISITFLHRSHAESEGFLQPLKAGGQPNVLRIRSADIHGPISSHTKIDEKEKIIKDKSNKLALSYCSSDLNLTSINTEEEDRCVKKIIHKLSNKAYKALATEEDRKELFNIFLAGRGLDSFNEGIRQTLTAILANPKFLYHLEPTHNSPLANDIEHSDSIKLGNRLALFIWGSLPDEELLRASSSGELYRPEVFEQQVLRLLQNSKADNLVNNFAYQWLNLDGLDEVDPDPRIFAEIPSDIRSLFKQELLLYVNSIFEQDKNIKELLTASHTYLNESLALHYGIRSVRGDRFRKVELEDKNRWGLLGKGGLLMTSSYPNRTSPVLRGAYVMEHLMGVKPTAPPPDVEALPENVEGSRQLTVRERLEKHRENPSCNGCHGVIDPLGFALENFDTVGRYRTLDRFARTSIDSSGRLPSGFHLNNAEDLTTALLDQDEQFVQAFTEKLMTFALSRPIEYQDMPNIRAIVSDSKKNNFSFSSIVLGIVNSPQFRNMQ